MKRPVIMILILAMLFIVFLQTCTKKEKEIVIGAVLTLTGPYGKVGESAKEGIEIAIEEINDYGGIQGRRIGVTYEDDQGEPSMAVSSVRKLITINKVPVIIGPMGSSALLAASPIAEKNHVVLVSPTASSPEVTHAGDYIFRVTYSDAFEGSKMAKYAFDNLGYRKIALLYLNNDYGLGLKDAFRKKFRELEGEIVTEQAYEGKATDFRTHLSKIKESKADAIYLAGYSEMGQVLRQARELGVNTPFISCIMIEISDVVKIARKAAEDVVYTHPAYDPQGGSETMQQFSQTFREKYGSLPDPEAAFSYDALKIVALAIEKGGVTSDGIRDALYQIKGYEGVTGETNFDENGDVIKPIGIKRVQEGQYVWILSSM